MRFWAGAFLISTTFAAILASQIPETGIPVTDPLVLAKCGSCHTPDDHGIMPRVSWERTTPEGWQGVLKRMIVMNGLALTPAEGRSIVAYLSASHGLAPEEAKPILYDAERRIHAETNLPNQDLRDACTKCHSFARALSWRRSADDWKQFMDSHAARYSIPRSSDAAAFLTIAAPLQTRAWETWIGVEGPARGATASKLTGRWLLTASVPGRGRFYG